MAAPHPNQVLSDPVALLTLLGAVRAYAANGEIVAANVNRSMQELTARATAAEAMVARLEAQNEELRRALGVAMGRLPLPAAPAIGPVPPEPEPVPVPEPPAPAQPDPTKRRRGRPRRVAAAAAAAEEI
jgi:hypothetical protein